MRNLAVLLIGIGIVANGCFRDHCRLDDSVEATYDVAYDDIPGVDPDLLSLDVYAPSDPDARPPLPVVVWVHGGAWRRGDKTTTACAKANHFTARDHLLVSVNYRLSPDPPDPDNADRVRYPIHPRDVATAVAFVHRHIGELGGDPDRIALLGHSAGAHLAALVSTDASFLAVHGLGLDAIRCTASMDVDAYDIPLAMEHLDSENRTLFLNAFGSDPDVWAEASPVNHAALGKGIPPFLLASRGSELTQTMLAGFKDALQAAAVSVTIINADAYNHVQVDTMLGDAEDTILTPKVDDFLEKICGF